LDRFLVRKDFNNFLTVNSFFYKTVNIAESFLLFDEETTRSSGKETDDEHNENRVYQHAESKRYAQVEHRDERGEHRDSGREDRRH